MKRILIIALSVLLAIFLIAPEAMAADNARRPAIVSGSDRVVELQRTDVGWEGTWYWYVGSSYNATNLTGVTALGLLEAYRDTKDEAYLDAAMKAADFIQTHLGAGATGTQYHARTTAPDIVFLHRLSEVTGNTGYSVRASLEWDNIKVAYPTAESLDALFRSINRPSTWDIAFFLEAAYLSGDTIWADDAAAILADTADSFYYDTDSSWYALNVAGSVRALAGCGYADTYYDDAVYLISRLISMIDNEGSIDGWVQDTSYAVLAFSTTGGVARKYANDSARWIASNQQASGGWLEGGREYAEINGEAVRAMATTIGINNTLDKFRPGKNKNSSWKKSVKNQHAVPFNGD